MELKAYECKTVMDRGAGKAPLNLTYTLHCRSFDEAEKEIKRIKTDGEKLLEIITRDGKAEIRQGEVA
jgi:hypothetical protein